MSEEHCPACGAAVEGGEAGCQSLMDELGFRAYNDAAYASRRDLAFDTYCMQHVGKYCFSAKSYAAHLTRLCCGLEYAGDPKVYTALQKWLNGKVTIAKPEILPHLGRLTVVEVHAAPSAKQYKLRVEAWAQEVWKAYTPQHKLARSWVKTALESQGLVLEPKPKSS